MVVELKPPFLGRVFPGFLSNQTDVKICRKGNDARPSNHVWPENAYTIILKFKRPFRFKTSSLLQRSWQIGDIMNFPHTVNIQLVSQTAKPWYKKLFISLASTMSRTHNTNFLPLPPFACIIWAIPTGNRRPMARYYRSSWRTWATRLWWLRFKFLHDLYLLMFLLTVQIK